MGGLDSSGVRLVRLFFGVSAVVLMALAPSVTSKAEPIFWDGLFGAYLGAGKCIAEGEDRGHTMARLRQAIEKHPQSSHRELAIRLANDLAESITRAEARTRTGRTLEEAPAEFLSETRLPFYLIAYHENHSSLLEFMQWHPRDPAVVLLRQGRGCIDELLLQLDNHSPTRAFDSGVFVVIPHVPRVSDIALTLIESVSQCRFSRPLLLPPDWGAEKDQRPELFEQIRTWWRENKDKSVAEGIRAQLPHGDWYSMLTMGQNLIRIAGETDPENRAHGLEALRKMARTADDYGAPAAEALAKYGDLSPVDWYYVELKQAVDAKGRGWDHRMKAMWYLMEHGGRREWELLCAVAADDIESANKNRFLSGRRAFVLGSLVNARRAQTSPNAIPLLGMALGYTEIKGSRGVNEKTSSQSFSTADEATEYLQKLTGVEFGYRIEGTPAERSAAIERAQKWWTEEGKAKYTFDYIEQNLIKPAVK